MEDIEDILHDAVWEYMDAESVEGVGRYIVNSLRANGYVIKRAVPPCRGYDFEENNDAA